MTDTVSSGIYIREEPPKTRPIAGVTTSVLAAAGVTERGPHEATLITSFDEYLKVFGGDTADSDLCPAVRGFFDEGGVRAWIKRVAHYDSPPGTGVTSAKGSVTLQSAVSAPGAGSITGSVAGPWDLNPGDDLDIKVDGGGTQTATFDAAAGTVTGTATENFTLSDGMTLLLKIDNGSEQTITFLSSEFGNIASATAAEVAAVINAKVVGAFSDVSAGAVRITSDTKGTASRVQVTGGTSASALGLTGADNTGTGDVANIDAVTAAEAIALIEADITTPSVTVTEATGGYLTITSDTVGASSSVQIEASSTADDEFGFDNAVHSGDSGAAADALEIEGKTDGAYTDGIRIIIATSTSGETAEFNLQVEEDGVIVETFANLTMSATTAERYAPTIINGDTGSNLIAAAAPGTPLYKRPADGTSAYLTGGDDGLTSLAAGDYTGNTTDNNGMRGFDSISDVNILIVPGQANKTVQVAMLTYCETTRQGALFAVLDPPLAQTASEMVTYVTGAQTLYNLSEYGAIYYPPVKVINPDTAVYGTGDTITIYPSGHIAGVYARNDLARPGGVYVPPAGIEHGVFRTVVGYESDETKFEAKRDLLYPKRINPLSIIAGNLAIDGIRTLKGDGNFPTVGERRGVIFIEYSLKNGLEFARNYFNNPTTRARVRRTIVYFLKTQMDRDAFRSKVPSEAFLVDVSDELNPPSVYLAGRMVIKVSLATQKPAEFITLIFSQDTRALDEELAAASA